MDPDTINFIVWLIIVEGVFVTSLCFFLFRVHPYRNTNFMRRRYYSLVAWTNLYLILSLSITGPLYFGPETFELAPTTMFTLELISVPLRDATRNGFIYATVLRYWMMCFDLNYAIFQMNDQWKSCINENYLQKNNQEKMWYHLHKQTFGNYSWMKRVTIFAFMVADGIGSTFYMLGAAEEFGYISTEIWETATVVYRSIHYFLIFLILLAIYLKCPKFDDYLSIREEIPVELFAYCILGGLYVVSSIAQGFVKDDAWNAMMRWVAASVGEFVVGIVILVFLWKKIQTIPHALVDAKRSNSRKNVWQSDSKTAQQSDTISSANVNTVPRTPKRVVSFTGDDVKKLSLSEVLRHRSGFRLFLRHLIKEFSSENLLCMTEMVQYQQLFKYLDKEVKSKELENFGLEEWEEKIVGQVNGTEVIPLSDVICRVLKVSQWSEVSMVTVEQIDKVARGLCGKYVHFSSCYQINISEHDRNRVLLFTRQGFVRQRDNQTEVQFLFVLFGDCIRELQLLMTGAFNRFSKTEDYATLLQSIE